MKREIKFRAWDGQKMYEWKRSGAEGDEHWGFAHYRSIENGLVCEVAHWGDEDLTIIQFTGLRDRNGKEIWEGDIVFSPYITPHGTLTDVEDYRLTVGFVNGSFALLGQPNPIWLQRWCKRTDGEYIPNYGNKIIISDETVLTVIGNIYENPELLKPAQS